MDEELFEEDVQEEEMDDDLDGEFYHADDLEARLASLSRLQKFKAASQRNTTASDSKHPPRDTQLDDGEVIETMERGEKDAQQEAFETYDFGLEEPDLDPRFAFGLRKPKREKPEYPTLIKLRPDLDPEVDVEALEERRRLGQIRRQAAAKRSAKVSSALFSFTGAWRSAHCIVATASLDLLDSTADPTSEVLRV